MVRILILLALLFTSIFCFLEVFSKKLQSLLPGLPQDISGYSRWTRINKKIIKPRSADPHRGFKRVYINRNKEELVDLKNKLIFPYSSGTIVVKEVRVSRKKGSKITLVSIMRKIPGNETTGGWDFIEYTRSSADDSFIPIQFPKESCYACHQGASDSDSVWTKFDNFKP